MNGSNASNDIHGGNGSNGSNGVARVPRVVAKGMSPQRVQNRTRHTHTSGLEAFNQKPVAAGVPARHAEAKPVADLPYGISFDLRFPISEAEELASRRHLP